MTNDDAKEIALQVLSPLRGRNALRLDEVEELLIKAALAGAERNTTQLRELYFGIKDEGILNE